MAPNGRAAEGGGACARFSIFCPTSWQETQAALLGSCARQTAPAAQRVRAMQAANAARIRAPARLVIASPRHLAKALHPDLIEIPDREQHAIDCRGHSQDFAPVIDRLQPMADGCLL